MRRYIPNVGRYMHVRGGHPDRGPLMKNMERGVRKSSPASIPDDPSSRHQTFCTSSQLQRSDVQRPKIKNDPAEETSYILTLLTSKNHQDSMNKLRTTYFPPALNKIPAHITLFHALPDSKLASEVLPAIERLASCTAPYRIRADRPFRLNKGVGINVADDIDHTNEGDKGRNMTRQIHARLRRKWSEWLSMQDSHPVNMHYTVMNKIDNERVRDQAYQQLRESLRKGEDISGGKFDHSGKQNPEQGDESADAKYEKLQLEGDVQGLILWRYDRSGHWTDPRYFKFEGE